MVGDGKLPPSRQKDDRSKCSSPLLHPPTERETATASQVVPDKQQEGEQLVTDFLVDYPKKLLPPAREQFKQTISPILVKKLPQAPISLQQAVVGYFQNGGSFYPVILQERDVEDWIRESLLLDIILHAVASEKEDTVASGKEEAVASGKEEAVASDKEEAVASDKEEAVASDKEEAVASDKEEAVASDKEEAVASDKEEAVASDKEEAVASDKEEAVASDKEEAVASGKEDTVASDKEEAVASGKEEAVASDKEEAVASDKEVLINKFQEQWEEVSRTYEKHAVAKLLVALEEKQKNHQLDLLALCRVLEFLPAASEQALALLHSKDHDWLAALKSAWLAPRLQAFSHTFSATELSQLSEALVHLAWSRENMTDFLAGIADEKDFSAIQDFLSLVAHATIPETALINALDSEPPEGGSVVQAWRHAIACFLLNNKLARLFPNDATLIQPQLAELLRHSYSYQALDDLLDTLLQANGQQASPSPDAVSRAKQFNQALDILCDYRLGETTRARALKVFQELPPADWESEIHFLAISSTFQSAHQRSVEELVDWIAEKSPQAFFANDREALQTSYQAVMAAYNLNSELVEVADQPIAQWDKATIKKWAKRLKEQATNPDTTPVTQQERVAVVKRAVELHEGFSPRATQLLAVLILRNPASNTGRLVQLNTGEGKSLIIAMLAALHALEGKPVDVFTTSTELSKREVAKYAAFFEMLDLSVGENSDYASKREVYKKAIVYGTPDEFQGDVLRDEFSGYDFRGKRKFRVLLVDEVDAMLFDNRSRSTYLTSQTPAMNHLAIVLAAIWYQVNNLARHLIEIEGQTFFVAEDFKVEGEQITVFSDKELSDCLVPVNDKEDFITKNTQAHLEKLLRELDPTEQAAWQDYRQLKARIETLSQAIEQQENEKKRKEKEAECKQLSEQLSQSPFSQAYPILEIPNHLRAFAKQQTPHWIKNALLAQFLYQKEVHYDVQEGEVVPIDYAYTGVLLYNLVWTEGLAQFLEMVEGLKIKPERISTNLLSTAGLLKRYGPSLYGLTGTLGNPSTQAFFKEEYGTDLVFIPPYMHSVLVDNANSPYLCKELPALLLPNKEAWYQAICETTLSKVRNDRAVLVICQYIQQVKYLYMRLSKVHDDCKIFSYTGQEPFTKIQVDTGQVIFATNIAGRGTDLVPTDCVEQHGGLHVCLTFLPKNYRVELQNTGRTARQGKRGSAQLVLHEPASNSIETLRALRDAKEAASITSAQQDVQHMLLKDRLFQRFCALESELFPTKSACEKQEESALLEKTWNAFSQEAFAPAKVSALFKERVDNLTKTMTDELMEQHFSKASQAIRAKARPMLEEAAKDVFILKKTTEADFRKKYEASEFERFCEEYQGHVSSDVLACFRERKPFVPEVSKPEVSKPEVSKLALAKKWGHHEKAGLRERWGLWLQAVEHTAAEEQTLMAQFEDFASRIRKDAQADKLVENPSYYVQEGNTCLANKDAKTALKAYNRAISLDPDFSLNAHYNKARALLTVGNNESQEMAKNELKEAKNLLDSFYKPTLLSFHGLVSQTGEKPRLSAHVQHQFDILSQQEEHINAAIQVINSAQAKGWGIALSQQTLEEVFKEAEEDHQQAIDEAEVNGLTHLFKIQAKEPKRRSFWGILGVALLGVVQVVAGVVISACTASPIGLGLIKEGVSDIITAVKSAITGTFSWKAWKEQKGIRLAVSIALAGWNLVKQGIQSIGRAVKQGGNQVNSFFRNVREVTTQEGKKGLRVAIDNVKEVLKKGVLKEGLNALVNYGVDSTVTEHIEKEIAHRVEKAMNDYLKDHALIQQALALDNKHQNNYWQNIFIQEGFALLTHNESSWSHTLREIVNEIARNELLENSYKIAAKNKSEYGYAPMVAKLFLQGAPMVQALDEVNKFTSEFLSKWHVQLEQHRQAIEEQAQQVAQASQQASQEAETAASPSSVDCPSCSIGASSPATTIPVHQVGSAQHYSSKPPSRSPPLQAHYCAPSQSVKICQAFSTHITAHLTNTVQSKIIRPITSSAVNWGVEAMTKASTKAVAQATEDFRAERHLHDLNEHIARKKEQKAKQASAAEQVAEEKLPPLVRQKLQEIEKGQAGDATLFGFFAKATGQPIALYDDKGRLISRTGKRRKGNYIRLQYLPGTGTETGHYQVLDATLKVNESGPNNCLYNAIMSQLSLEKREELGIHSGQDLRGLVRQSIVQDPSSADQLFTAANTLQQRLPGALYVGGYQAPAMQGTSTTASKETSSKTVLQEEVSVFLKACEQDSAFQQLRAAVVTTEAQLKDDPSNAELQKRLEDHRSEFQSHPLFQKGIRLGCAASELRIAAEDQAQFTTLDPLDKGFSASHYIAEATAIKEEVLTPVRQALGSPSSPRGRAKMEAVASGVGQSAWDTGKALLVDIPKMLKKFGINAAQSVATWEDKLGLQEGFASAKELLSALCQEVQYDWENPEEYRQRFSAAQEYQQRLMIHERSFNAEAYHLNNAKEAGYVTSEALQFVFGSEIVKGASKAVSVLRGVKTGAKAAREAAQAAQRAVGAKTGTSMLKHTSSQLKVPQGWIERAAKKCGVKYVNPKNPGDYIRFSPPNPDPRAPLGQKIYYFQRWKDGKVLTKSGEWVIKTKDLPKDSYHIPQTMFEEFKHLLDL